MDSHRPDEIRARYRSLVDGGADEGDWAYAWRSEINRGGFKAVDLLMREIVDQGKCVGCAACVTVCPTDVFDYVDEVPVDTRDEACVHCVLCADVCPSLRPPDPDANDVIGLRNDDPDLQWLGQVSQLQSIFYWDNVATTSVTRMPSIVGSPAGGSCRDDDGVGRRVGSEFREAACR